MQSFTPSGAGGFSPTTYFGTVLLSFFGGIAFSLIMFRGSYTAHHASRVASAIATTASAGEEMKMTLVVRKDLKMGTGKVAAQCSHAAVAAVDLITDKSFEVEQRGAGAAKGREAEWAAWLTAWKTIGSKKVTLRVDDEATMLALAGEARKAQLPHYVIQDAGRTQIAAGSRTVLAVGPAPASLVDAITGDLKVL
jgi:PTH2 family peptidyl-tRNA hydrolase